MKKLKVIGIGSRIMGDDGIGVYVVEELMKQQFPNDILYGIRETEINIEYVKRDVEISIEYFVGETDLDYCLDYLDLDSECFIIIIDAAISGKKPGIVTEFTINDMALCTSLTFSAHNHNLIEALYNQLHDYKSTIIGIEPAFVDFQLGLSDTLLEAFPYIMDNVKRVLFHICLVAN